MSRTVRIVCVVIAVFLALSAVLMTLLPVGRESVWAWTTVQSSGVSIDDQLKTEQECLENLDEFGWSEDDARTACLDLVISRGTERVSAPWSGEAIAANLPVLVPAGVLLLAAAALGAIVVGARPHGARAD